MSTLTRNKKRQSLFWKHPNNIARMVITLACVLMLSGVVPSVAQAIEYQLKNFMILVDDQLILKGLGQVNSNGGLAVNARSDLGSRNSIVIGGQGTISIPVEAPTVTDVAIIGNIVNLFNFARVSHVIYGGTTGGSYNDSGTSGRVGPSLLEPSLANNSLNDTGIPDLPDFPTFLAAPAAVNTALDVVVPQKGTVHLVPGNYRDLIVGAYSTVTFDTGGTYSFRRIIANTASTYSLIMADTDVQIRVLQFVRLAEYGNINPTMQPGLTFYVGGVDSPYGGDNKNKNGVIRSGVSNPAAWEYDGDGHFHACFVFVQKGTMNIRGHSKPVFDTQWFGDSLQQIQSISIKLQHPGEICFLITAECACITDFKLNTAGVNAGKLTVFGSNFKTSTVGKLAIFTQAGAATVASNINNAQLGGDAGHDQPNSVLTFAPDTGSFVTPTITGAGGLPSGSYYLGIIYPLDPNTLNIPGYCVNTNKLLTIP